MNALTVILLAAVGHFALHIAAYNRINATGLRRITIKTISKLMMVSCVTIPAWVVWHHWDVLVAPQSRAVTQSFGSGVIVYGAICLSALALLGIPWLLWRPIWGLEWTDAKRQIHVLKVQQLSSEPLACTFKSRLLSRVPGNQIFDLAVEEIELPVPGLPPALDGLTCSHFSDIHFTGQVSPAYMNAVIDASNRWKPSLCVITGDIVDKQRCIDWVEPVFARATAQDGRCFILGNHDLRVPDPGETRRALTRAGWQDVSQQAVTLQIAGHTVQILGNEYPWFPRLSQRLGVVSPEETFRILLSHSPDQLSWARRQGIPLMFAGHTHGGQGRLPLIGPVLSPSWHGSRYASGDFFKAPTTMHVSRGLGGVHLLRIRCRPELSLVTLRSVR